MEIIGKINDGDFIAKVSKTEIEKVFDQYYGKLETKLESGVKIDLGAGHDFREQIKRACKEMIDASNAFKTAQDQMLKFALMVSDLEGGTK